MRWISRLLRRRPKPTPPRPDTTTPGQRAADKALSRSRDAREEIQGQWPEVNRRASGIRRQRERNNFAALFRDALEGGHH